MSEDIKDLREKLAAKRVELKELFDSAEMGKYTSEQKEAIARRNEELTELVETVNLKSAQAKNEKAMEVDSEPAAPAFSSEQVAPRSIGEMFTESDAYKNYKSNGVKGIDSKVNANPLEYKTTLTTTGYPPEVLREPGILESLQRPDGAVFTLFDQIQSDQNSFAYLEETTFTNNAAEAAEGSAVGEAALAFTEQTESIRKMGVFLPVTDELLADVSGIQGYVNSRLQTMIRLRLDSQVLSGDGTAPNLEGILDAGKSSVGSTAFGSYSGNLGRIGAIYGAITDIRVNAFTEPDTIIMHPNDWNSVVTELTGFAGDSAAGYAANVPLFVASGMFGQAPVASIWGVKVLPTTAITENTVLVGKFGGGEAAHLVMRQGIDLAVSDSHSDYFTKNMLAIRATMRVGFPVYRQQAFHKITNF
jgi:HK97 family phage major capsid protein